MPDHVARFGETAHPSGLRYMMTTGQGRVLPMPAALLHMFNHATHRWGHITAAMPMPRFECEPLDRPFPVFSELAP